MINKEMEHLGTERSAIRELFEQGKVLKEKYGKDAVFDFSIGNPNIPCPKVVNDSLIDLLAKANDIDYNLEKENVESSKSHMNSTALHGYTSAQGDKDTLMAISNYLNKTYNADTDPKLIYLSVGAAAGLTITLNAITSGDFDEEVIAFSPYFPEYSVFIKNARAKQVVVKPDFDTFYPDFDDFINKINKNTNVVIINSPNNPTGVLYKEEVIIKICDILRKKEKEYGHPIYIISDEPYRELLYTDDKYPFITNYYDNSIITYSFSKTLSIPGERVGYILLNPKCENAKSVYAAICGAGRSLGFVCAPSLFQYAIPRILGYTSEISTYQKNAKLLYDELTNIGYSVIKPDGAFYMFVKALEDDDKNFSKTSMEYNLLLVPSDSFGIKGYVRIAYCVKEQQIIDAIPKFKELYNHYKN